MLLPNDRAAVGFGAGLPAKPVKLLWSDFRVWKAGKLCDFQQVQAKSWQLICKCLAAFEAKTPRKDRGFGGGIGNEEEKRRQRRLGKERGEFEEVVFCLVKRLLFLSRTPQPIKPEKHCWARLLSRFFKLVTWNYLSWSQPMSHSQHPLLCFWICQK